MLTQPADPNQTCVVGNSSGTVGNADVTNVTVNCTSSSFTIGGTVDGLEGSGLVLELNGDNDLDIDGNGSFTFDETLDSGERYEVTVEEQPEDPSQACTVQGGTGIVGSSNVRDVRVTCADDRHSIGGTVSGLLGEGLELELNGDDDLDIDSNGSFTFDETLESGEHYEVTVEEQPEDPSQECTVANGVGTVTTTDVTNVVVSCQ